MSLLDTTRGFLTPELISAATKGLGLSDESPTNVRGAAESSVPTLLAGMAQVASSESGAAQLFKMITERDYEGLLGRAGPLRAEQAEELSHHGQSMIARLFGDRASGMIDLISRSSGAEQRCSTAMLGLVAPIAACVLGREVRSRGLTARGLADLLSHHKQAFKDDPRAPAGLAGFLAPSMAASAPFVAAASRERPPHDAVSPVPSRTTESSTPLPSREGPARQRQTREWLLPTLLAAAVLGGLWAFARERRQERTAAEPTHEAPVAAAPGDDLAQPAAPPQVEAPRAEAPTAAAPGEAPPSAPGEAPTAAAPGEAPPGAPEIVEQLRITAGVMTLPGGKVLSVDEHGSEAEIARYLDAGAADGPRRFSMEGVTFRFGTTELTEASRPKIEALAVILDAYPSARVRIEGHTDAVGGAEGNRSLSLARAQTVRNELTARRIAPDRIEVAGMGAEQPAASNDTAGGRAQNRRIDVMVLSL
ncbi:OmpA family protein [Sorangium sp. So ce426]|uniref:OmpA family protein n=1 Tax=Sorangium sp. So ce426 TaxID=3133312 RepID=UPI003F5C41A0